MAVASGAAEIIGMLELALDVTELLSSLGKPADLQPWENEDVRIMADVKAWLQRKQERTDFRKSLSEGFKVETPPTARDATKLGP